MRRDLHQIPSPQSRSPHRCRPAWLIGACALAGPGALAAAGDGPRFDTPFNLSAPPADEAAPERTTQWSFIADAWGATVDGKFSLKDTPSKIDVGLFTNSSDDSGDDDDGAVGFHLRAQGVINRFVFFLDTSAAAALNENTTFRGATGDMDMALVWFEFGGGFRVIDIASPGDGLRPPGFSLDALVGGRVTTVAARFDPDVGSKIDGDHTWIEPFVGGQLSWHPVPPLELRVAGDVGGFGAGSNFSWHAEATVGWNIRMGRFNLNIHGGYRAIDQNFDLKSGEDLSGWDGVVHGPIAGVTFEF